MDEIVWCEQAHPNLDLKTHAMFCPVSLSQSMEDLCFALTNDCKCWISVGQTQKHPSLFCLSINDDPAAEQARVFVQNNPSLQVSLGALGEVKYWHGSAPQWLYYLKKYIYIYNAVNG